LNPLEVLPRNRAARFAKNDQSSRTASAAPTKPASSVYGFHGERELRVECTQAEKSWRRVARHQVDPSAFPGREAQQSTSTSSGDAVSASSGERAAVRAESLATRSRGSAARRRGLSGCRVPSSFIWLKFRRHTVEAVRGRPNRSTGMASGAGAWPLRGVRPKRSRPRSESVYVTG